MKHAEEAKLKDEEEKAAAARAAFEATFKDMDHPPPTGEPSSDSEADEADRLARKPIGPVDPGKCTAAGTGVGGGAAGAAASFVVVTKDSDGRRTGHGGAYIRVRITPGAGVGGAEQEAVVKDHADGTYTATYAVAKRGDYMVSVECNGLPILGSPFPVFFSGGNAPLGGGLLPASGPLLGSGPYINGVGQNMQFSMSAMFPGMLGMIPGLLPGSSGSTMGGLSQMPMAPSAAAMAAAQSIAAAQAYQAAQAAAAQNAGPKEGGDSPKDQDEPLRTLHVTNLSSVLTQEQLRQLFSYCGTVTDIKLSDSKQSAYVEYSSPDEAKAALALNNMEVGSRQIKVELEKKVSKPASKQGVGSGSGGGGSAAATPPLPMMMQQAVAMQQLQFQQALFMQQAMATQQAAARAATVKSAAEMAAARAADISKLLKPDGENGLEQPEKSASRSRSRSRSKSKSRSPVRYRRDRRSRSLSPIRYRRDRRSRSPSRERRRHRSPSRDRGSHFRGGRDGYPRYYVRREWGRDRERDHYSRSSHRSRSRSRVRRRSRTPSPSPRHRRDRDRTPSPRRRRDERSRQTRSSRRSRSLSKEAIKSPSALSRSRSPSVAVKKVSQSPVKRAKSPRSLDGVPSFENKPNLSLASEMEQTPHRRIQSEDSTRQEIATEVDANRLKETSVVYLPQSFQLPPNLSPSEAPNEIGVRPGEVSSIGTSVKSSDEYPHQDIVGPSGKDGLQMQEDVEAVVSKEFNKKSVRKPDVRSREKSFHSQDRSDEDEEELDDWRDDMKVKEKEKVRSKDRFKIPERRAKEEETTHLRNVPEDHRQSLQNAGDGAEQPKCTKVSSDLELRPTRDSNLAGHAKERERIRDTVGRVAEHDVERIATTKVADEREEAEQSRLSKNSREGKDERSKGRAYRDEDGYGSEDVRSEDRLKYDRRDSAGKEHKDLSKESSKSKTVNSRDKVLQDRRDQDEALPAISVVAEVEVEEYERVEVHKVSKRLRVHDEEKGEEEELEYDRKQERHRRHRKKHRHDEEMERGGEEEVEHDDEEDEDKDGEGRKDKRRHKRKHRKDEEAEKRKEKKRKHKHRRRHSSSESGDLELGPVVDLSRSKGLSDDALTRKKSSGRHKKRRRGHSKSASRSPSSSE
ncbi:hypothetical protein Mapa_004868 [Marchantia paleacea]|nr:hypothetical protein Mapa_004868 [Marchantia paleacea]